MSEKNTIAKLLMTIKNHCQPKSIESQWHIEQAIREGEKALEDKKPEENKDDITNN